MSYKETKQVLIVPEDKQILDLANEQFVLQASFVFHNRVAKFLGLGTLSSLRWELVTVPRMGAKLLKLLTEVTEIQWYLRAYP